MKATFRKYVAIFRLFATRAIQYRGEMLIWLLIESSPFVVMFAVWQQVFGQQSTLRGLSISQTIQYYLLIFIISSIVESHFEGLRCQEVRLGKIDFKMIRPWSYVSEILCHDLSSKLIYFLLSLPVIGLLYLIYRPLLMSGSSPNLQLNQLLLFLFLIVTSYVINFLIAFWIVLGSFWMEGSQGLEHFKWITVNLFSGMIFPLPFLPNWLRIITNWLPFKYLYAVPIGVLQQTYIMRSYDYLYLLLTILFLSIISQLGWQQAVKKYSSAGG